MFEMQESQALSSFNSTQRVHPTALVAKGAVLGDGVVIGPHAMIGPLVELAAGVQVGAAAIIDGKTTIGKETKVYSHATVGATPQDLKYKGEQTKLIVGARNSIREYVNISTGTVTGHGETVIGDDNLIMAYTHIAHDCIVGDKCIFANGVQIAGHVTIGDSAVFGGMAGAHQFCKFGEYAMIGAASVVVQDVPPYCMVQGDRAEAVGLNVVGLRRSGMSKTDFSAIKSMFKIVFKSQRTVEDAMAMIEAEVAESSYRQKFLKFLRESERGLCR